MIKYVVAAIILIVGLVIVIHGLYKRWKIMQIQEWPVTGVNVLSYTILPENAAAGTSALTLDQLPTDVNSPAKYTATVKYRYTVGGQTYDSGEFMYNPDTSYTAIEMRGYLTPIAADDGVVAYYNPDNNSEAYLYYTEDNLVYPLFGAVLVVIGVAIAGYTAYCASKRKPTLKEKAAEYYEGLDSVLQRANTEAQNYYTQSKEILNRKMEYFNKQL